MTGRRTQIADYQLLEELGSGDNGVVWKAVPPTRLQCDASLVAVKVLHHRSGRSGYERIASELRLYLDTKSDHLVPIFDAGHEEGSIFYASTFSERGSLEHQPLNSRREQTLQAIAEVARGVDDLHRAGLAHRNIKPSNILRFEGGSKLADIGLAPVMNPGQTSTGRGPVGNLAYHAPELVRGEDASRATDVFAIGVTLHKAISGTSVFPDIDGQPLRMALQYMLEPEGIIHPNLDSQTVDLIRSCIEKDPSNRPTTAAEVADAIQAIAVSTG